jgi:protein O-mannosyl-transferase
MQQRLDRLHLSGVLLLLAALLLVYSNHFDNAFHFDDHHTIVKNPAIRDLRNVPRLLTDGTAFSVLPSNQGWRPVVSVSLAIDYFLAGGLNPVYFHADVFASFVLLLGLYFRFCNVALQHRTWALAATAIYALHPVSAETVNYMIQRADLYVTLGCVAGCVFPRWWLPAFAFAALSKPTALVFPALLWAWMRWVRPPLRPNTLLLACVAAAGLGWLHSHFTPPSFQGGGPEPFRYWITQPYVLCHWVATLLWPVGLVADTDWQPFTTLWAAAPLTGFAGLAGLLVATWLCARTAAGSPIAFGLTWFLLASLPTALKPLAEVTNDHRMFLPYAGLVLAWTQALRLLHARLRSGFWMPALLLLWLIALSGVTVERNRVWHSEETLWRDVVDKSPRNGRAWMNYGLSLMATGRHATAETAFRRGIQEYPAYALGYLNLGICLAAQGRTAEAAPFFTQARRLEPSNPEPLYFEAVWLCRDEPQQACLLLSRVLEMRPTHIEALALLVELETKQGRWRAVHELLVRHADVAATEPRILAHAEAVKMRTNRGIAVAREQVAAAPSAAGFEQLSFAYWQAGLDAEALAAARKGLQHFPGSARLHNNVAAALLGMRQWKQAEQSADRALRLDPQLQLARNNRDYARLMQAP